MAITFNCGCGKTLRVPDEHGGRRAKCPACAAIVDIPAPDPVFEVVEKPKPGKAKPVDSFKAKPKPKRDDDDDSDDGPTYGLAKD
jgi:hypothetical protein